MVAKLRGSLRAVVLAVAGWLALEIAPAPAWAQAYGDTPLLSDEVLASQRGGFLVAGGLALDFGADMKTFVDGQLALETTLTWTKQGTDVQQVGPNGAVVTLPPGEVSSAVLSDPTGALRIVQALSSQAFANVVLNTASNHAVTQTTNVTLTLPGFGATQQSYQQAQVGLGLAQQLGMALTRTH